MNDIIARLRRIRARLEDVLPDAYLSLINGDTYKATLAELSAVINDLDTRESVSRLPATPIAPMFKADQVIRFSGALPDPQMAGSYVVTSVGPTGEVELQRLPDAATTNVKCTPHSMAQEGPGQPFNVGPARIQGLGSIGRLGDDILREAGWLEGETRIDPVDGNAYVRRQVLRHDGSTGTTGERTEIVVTDIFGGHERILTPTEWERWELAPGT